MASTSRTDGRCLYIQEQIHTPEDAGLGKDFMGFKLNREQFVVGRWKICRIFLWELMESRAGHSLGLTVLTYIQDDPLGTDGKYSCPFSGFHRIDRFFSKDQRGFKKVDPDRWEFANEGFLRGQKHLLKGISRRKPAHGQSHQQSAQSNGQSSSVGPCVEVGKFGLEEEVEMLKRDKNVLMQELVRLRQQQQATDDQLQKMVQRLHGMEQRQQQMMSFLAKAMQSPGFLAQFVQQQNKGNRRISEANKKRRLRQEGVSESESTDANDGQIVKYQPLVNEAVKMLRQFMKVEASPRIDFNESPENFLLGDGSSSSVGVDCGSSTSRVSSVTLQEVPPTSGQMSCMPTISEVQSSPPPGQFPDMDAVAGHRDSRGTTSIPQADVAMPEFSQIPDIPLESIVDLPGDDFPGQLVGDGPVPLEIDGIPADPEIDSLFNSAFWDDLLVQSPVPDVESPSVEGNPKESDGCPMENGWSKLQHMDQLTEQMGLLSSNAKGV